MSIGQVIDILRASLLETIIIAAPILIVALVIGLIISIIQATTSIQEQTLSFVPKIAAIVFLLVLLGGWMMASLSNYTRAVFTMIPQMAR